MKIPFDIKYRPQIESGEYKVENREGRPVRIICWDKKSEKKYGYHIVALIEFGPQHEGSAYFTIDGKTFLKNKEPELFIVTPDEELTEFEKELESFYNHHLQVCTYDNQGTVEDSLHDGASKLLSLAIDARAKELSEGLKQSKLDKDSIPYHLIEFMCNLYTCRNWKEIEETAELYVARIKAAAMKDLPRWYESRGVYSDGWIYDGFLYYKNHSIQLSSLEKLPGFKED